MKNNNRILIRRFKNDDRVDIFKCIYHDKKVQKFYFAPYMKKPIELNMRVLMNEEKLIFAIVHIRKNRVIGIINEQKFNNGLFGNYKSVISRFTLVDHAHR